MNTKLRRYSLRLTPGTTGQLGSAIRQEATSTRSATPTPIRSATLYRTGPAKLHAFGSGDFEEFRLTDLTVDDQEGIRAMFPHQNISYEELNHYVFDKVKKDPEMKVGDIAYIHHPYLSRPYYGMGVVYFDEENGEKSISFDEGSPYIPYENQKKQLRENNVTYSDIRTYLSIMPLYPYWEQFLVMWESKWLHKNASRVF